MNPIYHKDNNVSIKGLEYTTITEAEQFAYDYVTEVFDSCNVDANVVCIYAHGSRVFGDPKETSDLDFVVFYTGDEKEDSLFNILADEDYYIEHIKCDFNPIKIRDDKDIEDYIRKHDIEYHNMSEKTIIKIDKDHILNEDGISSGFTAGGYNCAGFSYSIMPLQFNLCLKGNDAYGKDHNKSFKHFVGDMVKGVCPYDNKKHQGMVKYLYYTVDSAETPKYVYILDMTNNDIIPIEPATIKKCVVPKPSRPINTNYFTLNATRIGYDLDSYSPVRESIDFNKDINESLSDVADDTQININRIGRNNLVLVENLIDIFREYATSAHSYKCTSTSFTLTHNNDIVLDIDLYSDTMAKRIYIKSCSFAASSEDVTLLANIFRHLSTMLISIDLLDMQVTSDFFISSCILDLNAVKIKDIQCNLKYIMLKECKDIANITCKYKLKDYNNTLSRFIMHDIYLAWYLMSVTKNQYVTLYSDLNESLLASLKYLIQVLTRAYKVKPLTLVDNDFEHATIYNVSLQVFNSTLKSNKVLAYYYLMLYTMILNRTTVYPKELVELTLHITNRDLAVWHNAYSAFSVVATNIINTFFNDEERKELSYFGDNDDIDHLSLAYLYMINTDTIMK